MTSHLEKKSPNIEFELREAYDRYTKHHPSSLLEFEKASNFLPGGNTRTVLYNKPFPFRIKSGFGPYLQDVDGNNILNLLGDFTAGLFGHSQDQIRHSVQEAMSKGVNLGAHNNYETSFARIVCERFLSIEKVRFTNSGTEATLMSITVARKFTGRSKIVVFEGGYHGSVFLFRQNMEHNAPYPWIILPYNDIECFYNTVEKQSDEIAAVIIEPMLGSGGCIPASHDFLQSIRDITEKNEIILIFDEVMTSRLSEAGMQKVHDISPDMTTLGKWIGGGMSFGAFGGRNDIMGQFDPGRPGAIAHAGTYNNNVLTMAAGITALTELYPPAKAIAFNKWAESLRRCMEDIINKKNAPFSITGYGAMMCIHPTSQKIFNYKEAAGVNNKLRELLYLRFLERDLYIGTNGFIAPSLPTMDIDNSIIISSFEEIISDISELINYSEGRI